MPLKSFIMKTKKSKLKETDILKEISQLEISLRKKIDVLHKKLNKLEFEQALKRAIDAKKKATKKI